MRIFTRDSVAGIRGFVGLFPYAVAETKTAQICFFGRDNEKRMIERMEKCLYAVLVLQ